MDHRKRTAQEMVRKEDISIDDIMDFEEWFDEPFDIHFGRGSKKDTYMVRKYFEAVGRAFLGTYFLTRDGIPQIRDVNIPKYLVNYKKFIPVLPNCSWKGYPPTIKQEIALYFLQKIEGGEQLVYHRRRLEKPKELYLEFSNLRYYPHSRVACVRGLKNVIFLRDTIDAAILQRSSWGDGYVCEEYICQEKGVDSPLKVEVCKDWVEKEGKDVHLLGIEPNFESGSFDAGKCFFRGKESILFVRDCLNEIISSVSL